MKRVFIIVLCLVLAVSIVGCGKSIHKSFTADGENFSAQANDGALVLTVNKDVVSETWVAEKKSEVFAIDYSTEHDDFVEFHIIALNDGTGAIDIKHTTDDGSEEIYQLTLSISRHQKIYLIIDTVSFVKAD